jgi:TP901 family phage tail tape measure protein
MSGVDAAATLSLQIDTKSAEASLTALETRMKNLGVTQVPSEGVTKLGSEAKLAEQKLKTMTAAVEAMQAKLDALAASGKTDIFGNVTKKGYELQGLFGQVDHSIQRTDSNLKVMLKSAEMAGAAAVKQAQDLARAKNQANSLELRVIAAEEAAKAAAAAKAVQELGRAKNQANSLELRVIAAEEAAKVKKSEQDLKDLWRAKNLANSLELRVIAAEEAARLKAAVKDAQDLAKWLTLTEKQRAMAALQAGKAFYGGGQQHLLPGAAGSSQALAAAQNAGSVAALESQLKSLIVTQGSLGKATRQSAEHQMHWNTIANEAHGAARGLSGALGGLWLTYGSLAPLLGAAVIAGSMKSMVETGKELEFQFTMISAISSGATVDMQKFNDAVSGTMSTPLEAAKGLRVLAQAGLSVEDATTALPSVLKLAAVGETDMANAALSATAIMHSFGLSVNDFGHIGDVFAKAAAISATSVKEMMEAMKQASAISNMFGVSMEETAASLATLANRGIEGSAAGTAITNMVRELSAPTTAKATAAMKQLGIEIYNADGSLKPFTERLQQLSEATNSMTEQGKTRFLEDIFNNRAVKAANILLTDLTKMKQSLEDTQLASEGLGFMTEAQIKLSQSTEGLLKTLQGDFQRVLADVFSGVQPQIASIINSLSGVVNSSGMKEFLTTTADVVAKLTQALLDNLDAVKTFAAAYLTFKGIEVASAAFIILGRNIKLVTDGLKALALVDLAATAANTAAAAQTAAAATAAAATASSTVVASRAGIVATVLSNIGHIASSLATPLAVVATGLGALVAIGVNWYKTLHSISEEGRTSIKVLDDYATSTAKVSAEVSKGVDALYASGVALKEQIRQMKEGKGVADAYAASIRNAPALITGNALAESQRLLDAAKAKVAAGPQGGGDATAQSREARQNLNELAAAQAAYDKVFANHEKVVADVTKANIEASEQAVGKSWVKNAESAQKLNEQLQAIKESGDAAKKSLETNTFAAGLSPTAVEATRKRLQTLVDQRDKTAGLLANQLSINATTEELQTRKAQIDATLESYTPADPRGANALFKAQTEEIVRGYADRTKAVNEEFNQYKKILDQRVKYGALAQGAENALLEQAQQNTDLKTAALLAAEKQELSTLLASKETTEAEKISMRTRIDAITAMQREGEVRRAGILALNTEKEALQQLSAARKLDNEIASFVEKEQLFRSKEITKEIMKKEFNPEDIVGAEAYYATLERGQEKLKEYAKAVNDAEKAQADFAAQVKNGSIAGSQQSAVVQKLTSTSTSNLDKYDAIFSQAAVQYNVNEALLKAVAYVESRGNANAVSNQGAQGLMQLMPATARSLGVTNSFDPQQNIFGGAKLLRENLNATGGDEIKALLMYHGGPNQKTWGEKTQSYPGLVNSAMTRFTGGSLSVAANDSVMSTEAVTQAMEANAKAVEDAKKAYEDFQAEVQDQAEANKFLMMSLKGPEEAVKRMRQEFSAYAEVADATLRSRKASGAYTDFEATVAEGDINRKKLEQLAEMKTAYEALGKAGEASAKQIQAQMIELSAHLDPVADKIRGIFENSLKGFFNDVTKGTKSVKEAFADLARGILKSFSEIIAKNASQEVMKLLGGGSSSGGLFGSISGIIRKLFNNDSGGGFSAADFANLAASHIDFAKGGVFSGSPSLHAYANTIQTTPKYFGTGTVHKFAKGGVFAEAGPEAVMPLTRDSAGRLGVRSQGSQSGPVSITVHVNGMNNAPDVRRAAGQGARDALSALNGARRYG